MTTPTTTAERSVATRGFSRGRYAAVLGVAATSVALFVLWSLNIGHGVYAFIVLGVAVAALTFFGGPERRARIITVTADEIRIARFHRIGTVIDLADLSAAEAWSAPDRHGRTQVRLVLTPRDPVRFFTQHRELRAVRVDDVAHVPAGTSEETLRELTAALSNL